MFVLSLIAFSLTIAFYNDTISVVVPEAPKATQDLQKVFLPPIYRMQIFVLSFDSVVLLYYIYQMPIWDCVKSKFPFFQYEAKTAEKADCTNLLLTIMFNCISKVSTTTAHLSITASLTAARESADTVSLEEVCSPCGHYLSLVS